MMEEQFSWKLPPEVFKILDTQDLHFLRATRKDFVEKHDCLSPQVRFEYLVF
jgi:hypothetical protein